MGKKWWNYFLPVFKAPHFWVLLFWGLFFFFFFSVSSASSNRVCNKKPIFIGFFAHPSKTSSDIMQQQGSKAKTPQKKGAQFFSETPFWPIFIFKPLILHHPLKTVQKKISKKPYFYRLKKRWPSYWPKGGQVIDPTLAKKWPSYWPYSIYIYIYPWLLLYLENEPTWKRGVWAAHVPDTNLANRNFSGNPGSERLFEQIKRVSQRVLQHFGDAMS